MQSRCLASLARASLNEPVHAPVPGNGMATSRQIPQNPCFITSSLFPLARCSSRLTRRLIDGIFLFIHANNFRITRMRKGTGSIFPIIANRTMRTGSKSFITPWGIAPRNSTTESIAMATIWTYIMSIIKDATSHVCCGYRQICGGMQRK